MLPLADIKRRYGKRELFLSAGGRVFYGDFLEKVEAARQAVQDMGQPEEPLVVDLEWGADSFARLVGALQAGRVISLAGAVPAGSLGPFLPHRPLLILKTGGTGGRPRHVVHAARRLFSGYALEERGPVRILILYAADHIAGLDAFFQALHRGSTLVIPEERNAAAVARSLEAFSVEVLPSTPTLLHFLLLSGELADRSLESVKAIPHGAEPMPPALRKRLQAVFPKARLINRFGMTETGPLPVRSDAEDPAALRLDSALHTWEVRDGRLFVRSPSRMLGTLEDGLLPDGEEWIDTGDLAEETANGAIRILGRRELLINVGGEKVIPEIVEALLLEQAGIREAAVQSIPNPMTGQAVLAEVVFEGEADPMGLLRRMRRAVRERGLSLAHVPTRVVAVEKLQRTDAGKRARSSGKS